MSHSIIFPLTIDKYMGGFAYNVLMLFDWDMKGVWLIKTVVEIIDQALCLMRCHMIDVITTTISCFYYPCLY